MLDQALLKTIRDHTAGQPVLSVYLETNAATGLWGERKYAVARSLDELEERLRPEALGNFRWQRDKVLKYLEDLDEYDRGIAIFSGPTYWNAIKLHVPVRDRVRYAQGAYLAPLVAINDEFQRYAVLAVDKERARIFLVRTGEIEESQSFRDDVPRRHSQMEHVVNAERKHAVKVDLHLKKAIQVLEEMHARTPFDRIVIGGGAEALPKLQRLLPKKLASMVVGSISVPMYGNDQAILEEARKVEESYERAKEAEAVSTLVTRAAKREAAVAGVEETLKALRRRQVFELMVADGLRLSGMVCPSCGMASSTRRKRCPICATPMRPADDLAEIAVEQAVAAGARIETVYEPGREELMQVGGLGALLSHEALKT